MVDTRAYSTASSSPSSSGSSSGKPKGKATQKLPGRSLIRLLLPGRSLIRPGSSNPLGQTAAGLSKAEKAAIRIPAEAQEVITGMLLGDGCIFRRQEKHNAWVSIEQKDKEFVLNIWELFNSIGIVGAAPRLNSRTGGRHSYAFATFSLPLFTELHKDWYKNVDGKNIKVIPSNIAELLTPRALGYWLAGDSHYHKRDRSIEIATHSFTPTEVDQLRAALLQNLNFESTRNVYNKAKEQYTIVYPDEKSRRYRTL